MKKKNVALKVLSIICIITLIITSIYIFQEYINLNDVDLNAKSESISSVIMKVISLIIFAIVAIVQFCMVIKNKEKTFKEAIIAIMSALYILGFTITITLYNNIFMVSLTYAILLGVAIINLAIVVLIYEEFIKEIRTRIIDKNSKITKRHKVLKIINTIILVVLIFIFTFLYMYDYNIEGLNSNNLTIFDYTFMITLSFYIVTMVLTLLNLIYKSKGINEALVILYLIIVFLPKQYGNNTMTILSIFSLLQIYLLLDMNKIIEEIKINVDKIIKVVCATTGILAILALIGVTWTYNLMRVREVSIYATKGQDAMSINNMGDKIEVIKYSLNNPVKSIIIYNLKDERVSNITVEQHYNNNMEAEKFIYNERRLYKNVRLNDNIVKYVENDINDQTKESLIEELLKYQASCIKVN